MSPLQESCASRFQHLSQMTVFKCQFMFCSGFESCLTGLRFTACSLPVAVEDALLQSFSYRQNLPVWASTTVSHAGFQTHNLVFKFTDIFLNQCLAYKQPLIPKAKGIVFQTFWLSFICSLVRKADKVEFSLRPVGNLFPQHYRAGGHNNRNTCTISCYFVHL